jgi:hypothetical protein
VGVHIIASLDLSILIILGDFVLVIWPCPDVGVLLKEIIGLLITYIMLSLWTRLQLDGAGS